MALVSPQPSPWEMTWIRRLANRYGHRTLFLALVGTAWAATGVLLLFGQPPPTEHLLHTYFPYPVRAAFWLIPAATAFGLARTRWEWVGFALCCLGPGQRAFSYGVGVAIAFRVGHSDMAYEFIGRLLIWILVILIIWVCGDWPNSLHVDDEGELQIADSED